MLQIFNFKTVSSWMIFTRLIDNIPINPLTVVYGIYIILPCEKLRLNVAFHVVVVYN